VGVFSQAVAAVSAAISVSVCCAVSFTGNTTHHSQPLSQKISIDDIAHRGPYFGARHTGSLDRAQSTIFLKPGSKSAPGTLALHISQSPMALTHLIMSAKASNKEAAPVAPAPAPAPKLEAPAPRPSVPKSLIKSGV
jgi:hypothetical protein